MSKTKNTSGVIIGMNEQSRLASNNVFIGIEAGINLTTESDIVIIGDYIHDLDKKQKNVLFIGEKVAIGKTLFGKPIDLFDTIIKHKV
jgi:hypothetical protein